MRNVFDETDDSKDNLQFMYDVHRYRKDPIAFYNEILKNDFKPYYQKQEEIIREFHRDKYGLGEPYNKLILACGQRGGKSKIGYGEAVYGFFEALTIKDRNAQYGISEDQLISIAVASNNMAQNEDGIYYDITNILEKSEWFNTWFDLKIRASDISCRELNAKIRPLSANAYGAAGRSVLRAITDEIDLFESTIGRKSSMELINVLSNATATFGTDGKVICCSSPKLENGTILTLYNRAKETHFNGKRLQPRTLAYKYPTWEISSDPNLTAEKLMERYKFDMDTFYRDFACDPRSSGGLVFPEGVYMVDKRNILEDLDTICLSNNCKYPHILAIDPAATNDKFGISIGYYDYTIGKIVIDGVMTLQKEEHEEFLSPKYVRECIDKIIDQAYVTTLIYDIYMYTEIIEHCQSVRGIEIVKHNVDKQDYDRIKEKQSFNQIEIVYDEYLQYEFKNLVTKKLATKVRVDHSPTSSKDMADCVANIVWYLTEQEQIPTKPIINKIFTF